MRRTSFANRGAWVVCVSALMTTLAIPLDAQRGRGGPPAPPAPRAAAPVDLTGQWVSLITEEWRQRQFTAPKGDFGSLNVVLLPPARKIAASWDPARDAAAGEQCKAYGAAGLMRLPTRVRVSWQDDAALKLETDAGTQTRTFRFGPVPPVAAERSWQGQSVAQWETPRAGRSRAGAPPERPRNGSLKVVTTNLRAGYLRKNGVPYSENATVTEYFSVAKLRSGPEILVVTAVVDDPKNLTQPFIVSSQFKRQADASGWDPTPCSATW